MTTPANRADAPAPIGLVDARRGRPGDDPIFALNSEATARRAKGERVLNATVGSLLNDDGSLAILATAARAVREVGAGEWAAYAPIAGSPAFLRAVLSDAFGRLPELHAASVAVATPGGTGALRHAITTFLEPGQALLTTSFYWNPYATIADEHDRSVATFRMFADDGSLDVSALDEALGELLVRQGRALVVLNDPCHNPTGYSMSAADWEGVVAVLGRHGRRHPVSVVLDAAYSTYGPRGAATDVGLDAPLRALARVAERVQVLVAWSASKAFTHYGLRVGALAAVAPDAAVRSDVHAALTYACRGTWSNCNRGGMVAVARLLTDAEARAAVETERAALVALLGERVRAFNTAARARGLPHPRYDGGFFTTVFTADADSAAARMRAEGVYVVPIEGALRLGLCSVAATDVERLVDATARAVASA